MIKQLVLAAALAGNTGKRRPAPRLAPAGAVG